MIKFEYVQRGWVSPTGFGTGAVESFMEQRDEQHLLVSQVASHGIRILSCLLKYQYTTNKYTANTI